MLKVTYVASCIISYSNNNTFTRTFVSALVNGRGRFNNNLAPLTTFEVVTGTRVRFNVIGALAEHSMRMSIDKHMLVIVESDGYRIEPIQVLSLR